MKLLKIFAVFALLHVAGWVGAHVYKASNPQHILIVVDTSFAMKQHFPAMQAWVENFESGSRYSRVVVGSDKAEFGEISQIKSREVLFRTVFGRLSAESLNRYNNSPAEVKFLLSDGSVKPPGWTLVKF